MKKIISIFFLFMYILIYVNSAQNPQNKNAQKTNPPPPPPKKDDKEKKLKALFYAVIMHRDAYLYLYL